MMLFNPVQIFVIYVSAVVIYTYALVMHVERTEDYDRVSVVGLRRNERANMYTHTITVSGIFFNTIADNVVVVAPRNTVKEQQMSVLHVDGILYFTYKRLRFRFARFLKISTRDVCLRRFLDTWQYIPCDLYKYMSDMNGVKAFTWDISNEVDYIERKKIAQDFDYYYTKKDIFILRILHYGEEVWSASHEFIKRFDHLYIMQQNDITYILIVYYNGNKRVRTVLAKYNKGWLTLPDNYAKYFKSYCDAIEHFPDRLDYPHQPPSFKLSEKIKNEITSYIIIKEPDKDKQTVAINKRKQLQENPVDIDLDLSKLKKCKLYTFITSKKTSFKKYAILAKMFHVFNKVLVGDKVVLDEPPNRPFLIIYKRPVTGSHTVKTLSYNKGRIYYKYYEHKYIEWQEGLEIDPDPTDFLVLLDISANVDERIMTKNEIGTSSVEKVSYTCREFLFFYAIHENGKFIWKFKNKTPGPITVSKLGKLYHISFKDTLDGAKIEINIKNDPKNEIYWRRETDDKWTPLSNPALKTLPAARYINQETSRNKRWSPPDEPNLANNPRLLTNFSTFQRTSH
ncbi:hypothetical protein BdWA1_002155 [Babesia duncani]|uniref:Uncharacterized protein n=1 Tax=Babesia duncani TaxID=323732 RepID=A0AAD9PL71_9APIC|nr:hypothetical protein BdWA1_002155 [Babesia duncani]